MKILIVGSKSIHVSSFVNNLIFKRQSISLLSGKTCFYPTIRSENNISFRTLNPFTIIRNYLKLKKNLVKLNSSLIKIHVLNSIAYLASSASNKLNLPVLSSTWECDVLLIPTKNCFFKYITRKMFNRSFIVTADSMSMIHCMKLVLK